MSKYKKIIPTALFSGISAITTYFAYDGYIKSSTMSNFELAASRLGFNGYKNISYQEHQEALLKELQIAGYFQPEKVWEDINRMGVDDPEIAFKKTYIAIKKSKADRDPSEFNAKILRKNLGKDDALDEQDVMDLLLYKSQHAFGRKPGQERNELTSEGWMNKYKEEYFAAAKILRLIDREEPEQLVYDGAWIAGASRIGLMARIIDYYYILSKYNIKVIGETEVLAGMRLLWANIDGISPSVRDKLLEAHKTKIDLDILDISLPVGEDNARVEEGREYMFGLAERRGIKLNQLSPFVQYKIKEDCPPGYFPGRVYPNYADGESRKLTETLMSQDLISNLSNNTVTIIDTLSDQHQRPTTASTARDVAIKFVENITNGKYGDKKEFIILFETNNPYIERQTIATQREVDKVVGNYNKLNNTQYKIKVEGVGFKCKQDVATVHSELGALVAEKWKTAVEIYPENLQLKRSIESLQFQTRDNSGSVSPMPDMSKISLSGNFFQDLFDEYL